MMQSQPFRTLASKILLLFSLLIGFYLRINQVELYGLNLDEIGQVLISKNSLWKTIVFSARDYGNAPLDYVITHFLQQFGQSELILRLPSVILGTLAILIIYLLGKEMFDSVVGNLVDCQT